MSARRRYSFYLLQGEIIEGQTCDVWNDPSVIVLNNRRLSSVKVQFELHNVFYRQTVAPAGANDPIRISFRNEMVTSNIVQVPVEIMERSLEWDMRDALTSMQLPRVEETRLIVHIILRARELLEIRRDRGGIYTISIRVGIEREYNQFVAHNNIVMGSDTHIADMTSAQRQGPPGPCIERSVLVKKIVVRPNMYPAEVCAVCLEEFEFGFEAAQMPCFHVYHIGCISSWLRHSRSCPLCRHEVA